MGEFLFLFSYDKNKRNIRKEDGEHLESAFYAPLWTKSILNFYEINNTITVY